MARDWKIKNFLLGDCRCALVYIRWIGLVHSGVPLVKNITKSSTGTWSQRTTKIAPMLYSEISLFSDLGPRPEEFLYEVALRILSVILCTLGRGRLREGSTTSVLDLKSGRPTLWSVFYLILSRMSNASMQIAFWLIWLANLIQWPLHGDHVPHEYMKGLMIISS